MSTAQLFYSEINSSCLCRLHKIEQSLQHVTLNNQQLSNVLHYYVCITGGILTVLLEYDGINRVIEFQPARYKCGFHPYGFHVIVSCLLSGSVCNSASFIEDIPSHSFSTLRPLIPTNHCYEVSETCNYSTL